MSPRRIVFIRHAEKPGPQCGIGIEADGSPDDASLAVRGWQRAGALAVLFGCSADDARCGPLHPDAVYASGVGPGSKSKRSMQTVAPLVALLSARGRTKYVTAYLKEDAAALMTDVLAQHGVVLVSWEHKMLPALIAQVPGAQASPPAWPDDRFDILWILDRDGDAWVFSQQPQLLLAGDSEQCIA